MRLTLFFSILSTFALLTSSASLSSSSSQIPDTTLTSTPTRSQASMTGTPATQPSFAPGQNNNGVRNVVIETIIAVAFGAVAGLSLLLASAWILWRISRKKRPVETEVETEREGKDTDEESVITGCEKEKEEEWKEVEGDKRR